METTQKIIATNNVSPIYVIQSESELLTLEAREIIFKKLKENDYIEKKLFTQTSNFNWGEVVGEISSQSFFSEKKIIDLRFPEAKLGREGAKYIVEIAKLANLENIVIVSLPLDWQIQKSVWLKDLCQRAIVLKLTAPTFNELPKWLSVRFSAQKLKITEDALSYLVTFVDGNLLAAKQEIDKLAAIYATPNGSEFKTINLDELQQSLTDVSSFTASDLRSAYMSGDWRRALHILDRLENEGVHPLSVSWLINDDVNKTMRVYGKIRDGVNEKSALLSEKLFYDRADNIKNFLNKSDKNVLYQQLLDSEILDLACKNATSETAWMIMKKRIMAMA